MPFADGVHLRLDEGRQVDAAAIAGLLAQPRQEVWAGLSLPPRTVLSDMDLWLATRNFVQDHHTLGS